MAICDTLLAERNSIQAELNSLDNQKSQLNLTAANQELYQNNLAKAKSIISVADNLRDVLAQLRADVDKNQCTNVNGLGILLDKARRIQDETNQLIGVLNDAWADTQARLAASQKATETQDNAGTGAPGTAPSSQATPPPQETGLAPAPVATENDNQPTDDDDPFGLDEPPTVSNEELGVDDITDDDIPTDAELDAELAALEDEALANTNQGLEGEINDTRAQATQQDVTNFKQKADWRVRLSLSPGAFYLYKDPDNYLLSPLDKTDGIVFPYIPTINVTYGANYQSVAPVHSNYKIFQYENSFVDAITITGDFTAQDTTEARYVLAVIHFLKSVTKMFYGQDFNPKPGTPPPLCYLSGLGEFQYNAHPLAITNFTYSLPNDVDYIRAGELTLPAGTSRAETADESKPNNASPGSIVRDLITSRLGSGIAAVGNALGLKLQPGGISQGYQFGQSNRFNSPVPPGTIEPTYVPTKIQISVTAIPIVSRYDISSRFSLADYEKGLLNSGVKNKGGGIW
jgi:hypothetical protein